MSSTVVERGTLAAPGRSLVRLTRKQMIAALLAIILVPAALAYGWQWWTVGRFLESTDDAYVGGNVTALSPHVAGFVSKILVTDNQFVHAGDPMIELDDRDYRAKLAHAEAAVQHETAALANLHAEYTMQQSTIDQMAASLASAKATAGYARIDADRYHNLALTSYGSAQNDQKAFTADRQAQAGVQAAEATLAASRQKLTVIDTQIAETEASLAQAKADRETAVLDLGYTHINAPIDGYVGARGAQVGAYVTTGTTLLSVVPSQGLWVDANFKEDQLAHMRPGQDVNIIADIFPGRVFHGRVQSLAPATGSVFAVIPAENATGNFTKIVQRVPVRVALGDEGGTLGLLRAGLSVVASVDTRDGR